MTEVLLFVALAQIMADPDSIRFDSAVRATDGSSRISSICFKRILCKHLKKRMSLFVSTIIIVCVCVCVCVMRITNNHEDRQHVLVIALITFLLRRTYVRSVPL